MINREEYSNIPIPDALDDVINESMSRARNKQRKHQFRQMTIVLAACISLILVIQVPAVAAVLEDIPIIGTLVRTFQFGEGGERTDGLSTEPIVYQDTLSVYFHLDNSYTSNAPNYTIEKKIAPNRVICTFSGVRNFDYKKLVEEAGQIKGIKDVYRVITLDDSVISFVIELDNSYSYTVSEYKEPGYVNITFMRHSMPEEKTFYIRSNSTSQGEALSNVRDAYSREGASIVKTKEGLFCMVLGTYETKEKAEEKLSELNNQKDYKKLLKDYNLVLSVEEGSSNENPR